MIKKSTKDVEEQKQNKYKYNLAEVIVIMIITAICSVLITINVTFLSNKKGENIKLKSDLSELEDIYKEIVNNYYTEVDSKELIDSAISGMLEYLDDPYSTYLSKEETEDFNIMLNGQYVGIGTEISRLDDNNIYVVNIYDNSPAQNSGLKVNDIILKINGEDITKLSLDEISNKIRNDQNTKIKLLISRDGKEEQIEIVKSKIELTSVESRIINKDNKKIAVIKLSIFANNTYQQFKNTIDNLKKQNIDGIIIDVRSNTGGYLKTAKNILELFLDKDQIMYQLETRGKVTKIKSEKSKSIKIPVSVLVNSGSASASEVFTAALKENLNVPVIGTTTYGKGKTQNTSKLSTGAMIKYTTQFWLTPNGDKIDGKGIEPTIKLELDEEYYKHPTDDNDNQLQEALEIMSK